MKSHSFLVCRLSRAPVFLRLSGANFKCVTVDVCFHAVASGCSYEISYCARRTNLSLNLCVGEGADNIKGSPGVEKESVPAGLRAEIRQIQASEP